VRPEDDELKNVVQMQRMFTRIIEGDYIPLPLVSLASRRHAPAALPGNIQSHISEQCLRSADSGTDR